MSIETFKTKLQTGKRMKKMEQETKNSGIITTGVIYVQ